jgi:hypothetical protein
MARTSWGGVADGCVPILILAQAVDSKAATMTRLIDFMGRSPVSIP